MRPQAKMSPITMTTAKKLFHDAGGSICRRCINRKYNLNLKRTDCLYGLAYPGVCTSCGAVQNIVTSLRLRGKIKLLLR